MTTVTLSLLVPPQQLTATDTAIYTAPKNTTAKISRAVFTNTSGSPVTITAGITAVGQPLAAAQTLIAGRSLAAGQSYVSPELAGAVIPSVYGLHAYASAGGAVTVKISGLTVV